MTAKSPKSLMRMFGPNGNPQARNLFEIIGYLQKPRISIRSFSLTGKTFKGLGSLQLRLCRRYGFQHLPQ